MADSVLATIALYFCWVAIWSKKILYFVFNNFRSGWVMSEGKMTFPVLDNLHMTRQSFSDADSLLEGGSGEEARSFSVAMAWAFECAPKVIRSSSSVSSSFLSPLPARFSLKLSPEPANVVIGKGKPSFLFNALTEVTEAVAVGAV